MTVRVVVSRMWVSKSTAAELNMRGGFHLTGRGEVTVASAALFKQGGIANNVSGNNAARLRTIQPAPKAA
jgi:hypothetical protein